MRRITGLLLSLSTLAACGSDADKPSDTNQADSADTQADTTDTTDTSGETEVGPPTVSWGSPASGTCHSGAELAVAGTAGNAEGLAVRLQGQGPGAAIDVALGSVVDGAWSGSFAAPADGPYELAAHIGDSASASVELVVDRVAPSISFELPARIDGLSVPDADPADGYQVAVSVAVVEATSPSGQVCLALDGGTPDCKPFAAEVGFLVTLDAGGHMLTATATDGCGLVSEPETAAVELAFDNPVTVSGGGLWLAKDDEDPATATVYEGRLSVVAPRAVEGAAFTIECRPAAQGAYLPVIVQPIETIADTYEVAVALDTTVLGHEVECRAALDLPAAGVSEPVALTLALPAPSFAFAATPACARQDLALSGTASSLDGQTVSVGLVGQSGFEVEVADGVWSGTLVLGELADGDYMLTASGSDAFGNMLADHGAPSVALAVDRTAPVSSVTAPVSPVAGDADSSAAAGMQVDLVFDFIDARGGGEICASLDGASLGCRPSQASVTFEDVTIQGGNNAFVATATDGCGNAVTFEHTVFHATESPVVVFVAPGADLATADTHLDFVVSVSEPDRTTALPGLEVRLFSGDTELAALPVDLGDGTYRFEQVALPEGRPTTFTARATRPGSVGVSGPRVVTQKNVEPEIALTSPTAGTLNLASAVCAGTAANCALTATVQTTNAEDGSEASLEVSCGAGSVKHLATVTSGAAAFPLTLTHGSSCTLTPSVTDLVGQAGVGAPVAVTVDRVAPTLTIATPPTVLLAQHDIDASVAGIQTLMRVEVGGVSAGAEVVSTLSWSVPVAGSRVLGHTVATTTPDGATYTATFEDAAGQGRVTWPEGVVTWRITVSDPAGNSTSLERLVTVDSEASVRVTGPSTTVANQCGAGCGANAVCHQDTCWLLWGQSSARQIVAVVGGLDSTGQNLRVCSDSAALAAANAPACDSTHPSGGTFRQALITNAVAGINSLDVSSLLGAGHHRVVVEARPHDGGAWISSYLASASGERERRLFIDLTPPVVSAVTSPSDTLAPTGTLNAAEQKALPRVYDISFQTDTAGQAELMVNGSVAATRAATVGLNTASVTLPEGSPQVWVVVTDAAGNRSPATPALGAASYVPVVDVTPPSLSFSRPNASPIKSGDNLDVLVASNAEGRTVTLFDGPTEVATAVVTGGVASFPHASVGALSDGVHTLSATITDLALNPATASTNPLSVTVDTTAPMGVIVSPENPTGMTDLEDSDPDTVGFQLDVELMTSQGAVSWSLWTASGCTLDFDGCGTPVQRAAGTVQNPNGPEAIEQVSLELSSLVTQHKIILRTVDEVGNVHVAEAGVQVIVLSCAISMRDLPASGWFNGASCATPPSCASADVQVEVGVVGLCGADELRIFDGDTQVAPARASPGSAETFVLNVADGQTLSLEARAYSDGEQVGSTGVYELGVDLAPPTTRFVATQLGAFTTPADGSEVDYGVSDDLSTSTSGMQLHLAVEVADPNVAGGAISQLVAVGDASIALSPSNGALPRALTGTSPATVNLLDLTLASGQSHTVTVSASDAAGNVSTSSFVAHVDVVSPAAVVLDEPEVDTRGPRVTLTWTAVGDDGSSGLPAGYEVRYAAAPLTEDNWDAACDASVIYGSELIGAPVTAGQVMSTSFGGPDTRPFSDPCKLEHVFQHATPGTEPHLHWGVRAVDELGNRSPLATASTEVVTHDDIQSRVKRVRFSNTNNAFGSTNLTLLGRRGSVLGDLNGDGRADWASYSANSQALCIFAGRADQPEELVVDTLSSATHACLLGSQMGSIFTGSTQTGHFVRPLGDVNGDGFGDFAVAGKITNGTSPAASEAYMLVYFGRAGSLPDLLAPNIRIRGIRALTGTTEYIGVCSPGDFDGLGATKTSDIAFGEPFASRVHVIPGNIAWTTATNLTINLTPGGFPTQSGTALVDHGAWTVEAIGTWGITATAPAGAPAALGLRCGSAGDVLPTPAGMGTGAKDDLFVHQSGSLDARVFIFAGREWAAGTVEQVTECIAAGCVESPAGVETAEDQRAVRLRQDLDKLCQGFGGALQGGVDLTGDGVPDFLATLPLRSTDQPTSPSCSLPDGKSVFVFDGSKFAGAMGQNLRVGTDGAPLVNESWTGPNGWALKASVNGQPFAARAIGNYDGWDHGGQPLMDIAIGNRLANTMSVRMNHARAPLSIAPGQFPVVDGEAKNPFSAVDNSIGEWVDGGVDLTGDGLPDFLTGSRTGEVLIIH